MDRKPLSGKERFGVFERDRFTCRYCGRSAPTVQLEIDHVTPVSKNGHNGHDNLVTSCVDCNRSKSARIVATPQPSEEHGGRPEPDKPKEKPWPVGCYFFTFNDEGKWSWSGKVLEALDGGFFRVSIHDASYMSIIGGLSEYEQRVFQLPDMAKWEFQSNLDSFWDSVRVKNARMEQEYLGDSPA